MGRASSSMGLMVNTTATKIITPTDRCGSGERPCAAASSAKMAARDAEARRKAAGRSAEEPRSMQYRSSAACSTARKPWANWPADTGSDGVGVSAAAAAAACPLPPPPPLLCCFPPPPSVPGCSTIRALGSRRRASASHRQVATKSRSVTAMVRRMLPFTAIAPRPPPPTDVRYHPRHGLFRVRLQREFRASKFVVFQICPSESSEAALGSFRRRWFPWPRC